MIIFVHGVCGDPVGTWTNDKVNFPEAVSKELGESDVLSFGYKTDLQPGPDIDEVAGMLGLSIQMLLTNKKGKPYETIRFVAHSMGGLVVREYLLKHYTSDLPSDLPPVTCLITLGTPNRGAGLAKWAQIFPNQQFKQLRSLDNRGENEWLTTLNRDWKDRFPPSKKERPLVYAAFETEPMKVKGTWAPLFGIVQPTQMRIVDRDSASEFSDERPQPLRGDHFQIAKPLNTDDERYFFVISRLKWANSDEHLVEIQASRVSRLIALLPAAGRQSKGVPPNVRSNPKDSKRAPEVVVETSGAR